MSENWSSYGGKRVDEIETRIISDDESVPDSSDARPEESFMRIWKDEKGGSLYFEGRITIWDLGRLSKNEIDRFGAHLHSLSTAVNWSMAISYAFGRLQNLAEKNKRKKDDMPDKDNGKIVLLKGKEK